MSTCSCDSVALVSSRTTLQLLIPPSAFAACSSCRRCLPVAHSDFVRLQSHGFVLNLGYFQGIFLVFLSCDGSTTKRCSSWYGFLSWVSKRIAPHRRHGSLLLYRKVRRTHSNHQGEPPAAPAPHPLRPTRPASSASPASRTSLKPMTARSATFRASGKLATRFWPATHAA